MSDKICMVTGANGGIGKEITRCLARQGARVVLVCRDEGRGRATIEEISKSTGNDSLELLVCDLSSMRSVRSCAHAFRQAHDRLHVLVNTAAVFSNRRAVTEDALELMFETNYLGPFLLTNLLLDELKAGSPSRIITLSAPSTTRLDFADLQSERKFGALHAFGASKTADLLFSYELARSLEGTGVTSNVLFPGVARTDLMKSAPAIIRFFVRLIAKKPEIAANAACYLASEQDLENVTGKFFKRTKISESSAYSRDPSVQQKLKEAGIRLTGLS